MLRCIEDMNARECLQEVVSRKGIEPLTPGLGNLCSILLSYRDKRLVLGVSSARGGAGQTMRFLYHRTLDLPMRSANAAVPCERTLTGMAPVL